MSWTLKGSVKFIFNSLNSGQDVKRYPYSVLCGVRFDNRKVLYAPGRKTKYFELYIVQKVI